MHYAPPYILKYLQDSSLSDMERSQLILETEPENERDQEYIYTFSTTTIRTSAPPQEVIDRCDKYLPLIKTEECRKFLQSIRIWKYEQLEQFDKSIALRKAQIEEYPDETDYYKELAQTYRTIKDNENAIKYYEQYVSLRNDSVDTDEYEELADIYEDVNDFKNSAKYHEKSAAWEARFSADYWQLTGRALALDGQIDEAMFYFKFALKIDPKDAYSHYFMGRCYQDKKDKYRALHHYTQALKYKPDFAAVHLNIGAIEFNEEGDIKEAIKCFETAIDKDTKGEFLLLLYRNLRMLYKEILEYDKSEYYRGKIFELAGFPADMGQYLDEMDEDDLDFNFDDDSQD
ncbi:MAG: tetratricopeptide repeat protein [Saprospiraceae bacterium]|nr:tetratricopeptide repeat protein [Saprospiraceae bacterium]